MGVLARDFISVAGAKIKEIAVQENPQEKLFAQGHNALSDCELLAILLRAGFVGVNALELGQQLLKHFGSLGGLSRCTVDALARIKGVGNARALQLAAAFALASRLSAESVRKERIDSPERVFQLLGMEMRVLTKESLRVVLLDTRFQLMRVEEISRGTVNESIAHPRDIFGPVFTASAYAFILVHNHPSGDPSPSDADRKLTARLTEAARLLQVQLLDHVILGSPDNGRTPWFSFKQLGLI